MHGRKSIDQPLIESAKSEVQTISRSFRVVHPWTWNPGSSPNQMLRFLGWQPESREPVEQQRHKSRISIQEGKRLAAEYMYLIHNRLLYLETFPFSKTRGNIKFHFLKSHFPSVELDKNSIKEFHLDC